MTSLSKAQRAFLSPLLLAGAAFLSQTALKASFKNPNLNMYFSSQVNRLFDLKGSQDQSIEASESTSLEVFGDYLTFMLLSVIFHLMMILFIRVKGYNFKGKHYQLPSQDTRRATCDELTLFHVALCHEKGLTSFKVICEHQQDQQENSLIKLIQPLIKGALCYTLAFCFFKLTLFCAFTFYTSQKISPQPFRLLDEERGPDIPPAILDNKTPEKISLAVGRILASFDVESTVIAISQDEKWAYVSAKNPQLVRIYDTSDFKAPKQVATVNLGKLSRTRVLLELSPDETIFTLSLRILIFL